MGFDINDHRVVMFRDTGEAIQERLPERAGTDPSGPGPEITGLTKGGPASNIRHLDGAEGLFYSFMLLPFSTHSPLSLSLSQNVDMIFLLLILILRTV